MAAKKLSQFSSRSKADLYIRQQLAQSFEILNNQILFFQNELEDIDEQIAELKLAGEQPKTELIRHRTSVCSSLKTLSIQLGKLAINVMESKNLLTDIDESQNKQNIKIEIYSKPPTSCIEEKIIREENNDGDKS